MDFLEIKLTNGKTCKLDIEDEWILKEFNIYSCRGHVKATKSIETKWGSAVLQVYVHRLVMGITKTNGIQVDHINRDGHDNRRTNLRFATYKENSANKRSNGLVGYKGVCFVDRHKTKKYLANIRTHGGGNVIGYFKESHQAAKVYDMNALLKHKEFAYLNFPELKQEYIKLLESYGITEEHTIIRSRNGFGIRENGGSYTKGECERVFGLHRGLVDFLKIND